MIVVVSAHPYPDRARANRVLTRAIENLPGVTIRSLYDLYPDFDIDVEAEQAAITAADVIVFQHPIFWYAAPALLKLWFETVLVAGFAYGDGGRALAGKRCLWVVTTGGDEAGYSNEGMHGEPFESFVAPMRQTARFCGMEWLPPIYVHGAHRISERELLAHGERLRDVLVALLPNDEVAHA